MVFHIYSTFTPASLPVLFPPAAVPLPAVHEYYIRSTGSTLANPSSLSPCIRSDPVKPLTTPDGSEPHSTHSGHAVIFKVLKAHIYVASVSAGFANQECHQPQIKNSPKNTSHPE
jgi:hypothetical protein